VSETHQNRVKNEKKPKMWKRYEKDAKKCEKDAKKM
jgi:hypothetical protein